METTIARSGEAMNEATTPPTGMNRFLVLDRKDWNESTDSEWCVQERYLFNGREMLLGEREICGRKRKVYLCLNEEECVAWFPEIDSESETGSEDEPNFLRFEGKNWKLAGDCKWKPSNFCRRRTYVGTRVICGEERDIFREDGFDSYVAIVV